MTVAERQRRYRNHRAQREESNMTDATTAPVLRPAPPPLPATRSELLAGYKLKRRRNINDLVEEIIVKLWDNDENFMKYVEAIYDSDAVEGSLVEDDTMAALIIRDVARKEKQTEVADKNLHTIKLAMKVGLRRFGVSRPERDEEAQRLAPTPALPSLPTQ
jgi:hypothetical protein